MLTAHEGRLQRLEAVQSELVGEVAEQAATLKAFSHQIQLMTDSVCSKLDSVYDRLDERISSITSSSRDIAAESQSQKKRIEVLERDEKREEKQIEFKHKIVFYLLSGAGGALAMLLAQLLKTHF